MNATLKLGLIGFGRIAELFHLKALLAAPGAQVTAIAEAADERRARAQQIAPGAACLADYRALLARADVDAVVICLPPALHAESAVAAFAAGKHVYLEKPLALSLEEGDAVQNAWRSAGKVGMLGFNFRFHPLYQQARSIIASGKYGALVGARSYFGSAARALPEWKHTRATGGGVLLDLATHHVDLARYLFDQPIVAAAASVQSQRVEADNATLQLQFASGALMDGFFSMNSVSEHRYEIYMQQARLTVDTAEPLHIDILETQPRNARLARIQRTLAALHPQRLLATPGYEPSFNLALAAFVQAARAGRQTQPDIGDGYESLRVILAAEEAARTGQRAAIPAREPLVAA